MPTIGTLTLVATPIGNLGDMTPRAADALVRADIIACEDTRTTRKLLALTGIASDAKLKAYHDHNGERTKKWLVETLVSGSDVALVSDAGTPLISDPGYKLVAACHEAGIEVRCAPGPSAVLGALCVSGLPTDRFMFCGFVANTDKARLAQFDEVAGLAATTVWFESPKRLARSLATMAGAFGTRRAVVARELTKMHEEVVHGRLDELAAEMAERESIKGEIVVVVAGRERRAVEVDDAALERMLLARMKDRRLKDAVKSVTDDTGLARNRVYRKALELAGDGRTDAGDKDGSGSGGGDQDEDSAGK